MKRIQFNLSDEAAVKLDESVGALGAASRAEVLRRSVDILDTLIRRYEKGKGLSFVELGMLLK